MLKTLIPFCFLFATKTFAYDTCSNYVQSKIFKLDYYCFGSSLCWHKIGKLTDFRSTLWGATCILERKTFGKCRRSPISIESLYNRFTIRFPRSKISYDELIKGIDSLNSNFNTETGKQLCKNYSHLLVSSSDHRRFVPGYGTLDLSWYFEKHLLSFLFDEKGKWRPDIKAFILTHEN